MSSTTSLTRRGFARRLAVATTVATAPWAARANMAPSATPRVLEFTHLHTGERLSVEFHREGGYLPDALSAINQVLRDFRTGDVHPIDTALLDLLHDLHAATGSRRPYEIISAYRSPNTNQMLRGRSSGVASGSLHLSGKAIDIRLADVALADLRDAALSLGRGGVGFYAGSNFVHVDTGRVRRW